MQTMITAQSYSVEPGNTWDANLDSNEIFFDLSPNAATELRLFLDTCPGLDSMQNIKALETISADGNSLTNCAQEIQRLEVRLQNGPRLAILRPVDHLSFGQQLAVPWVLGQLMGTLLEQNDSGDRAYLVADRGGRMEQGARYSQTNQGGSFHTDGVNLKSGYDYFLLHCVASAPEGGESVLLNGFTILQTLQETAPDALRELCKDFVWEYKGIYKDKFYHEPIVKIEKGELTWRYLRNYIEEAAQKTETSISVEATNAMDRLDTIMDDPTIQFRYKLKPGETAIINDKQIFHGRTPFRDQEDAVSFEDHLQNPNSSKPIKRTYSRFWVNKLGNLAPPE